MQTPLEPNESVAAYHDAQGFTRFMGTVIADQPLEVSICFSNDEVDDDGHPVSDENISNLHYDSVKTKMFDPAKSKGVGEEIYVIIAGRWLKVSVKNVGKEPIEWMRAYVRGSVF